MDKEVLIKMIKEMVLKLDKNYIEMKKKKTFRVYKKNCKGG